MLERRYTLPFRWFKRSSATRSPEPGFAPPKSDPGSPPASLPQPVAPPHLGDDFWDIDEEVVLSPSAGRCYEIELDTFFNARHSVVINGRQGPIHDHSYRLQVRCRSNTLERSNHTVAVFHVINDTVEQIARVYNNRLLNDLPPFRVLQSTSECLSAVLFQQIQRALAAYAIHVVSVTIWESPTRSVTYGNVPSVQ